MKKLAFLSLIMLSINSFALLEFSTGRYTLEGYIKVSKKTSKVYLVVNQRTNSEVEFLLKGDNTKELQSKDYTKVLATIQINKSISSDSGDASLVKIIKYYDPEYEVEVYSSTKEIKNSK